MKIRNHKLERNSYRTKKIGICVFLVEHLRLSVGFEKLSKFLLNWKLLMWRKRYDI
jgi:hypothetical protein